MNKAFEIRIWQDVLDKANEGLESITKMTRLYMTEQKLIQKAFKELAEEKIKKLSGKK